MEKVLQFIVENWTEIAECALMVLAYFLFFLYNSKVKNTRVNLLAIFKKGLEEVYTRADALRTQEKRIRRLEDTVAALLDYKIEDTKIEEIEEVKEDECTNDEE